MDPFTAHVFSGNVHFVESDDHGPFVAKFCMHCHSVYAIADTFGSRCVQCYGTNIVPCDAEGRYAPRVRAAWDVPHPRGKKMNIDEAVSRACEEPTLADALSWIAIWETERVVKQMREYDQTGVSTASHGGGWDTCFKFHFQLVLERFALKAGIKAEFTDVERSAQRMKMHHRLSPPGFARLDFEPPLLLPLAGFHREAPSGTVKAECITADGYKPAEEHPPWSTVVRSDARLLAHWYGCSCPRGRGIVDTLTTGPIKLDGKFDLTAQCECGKWWTFVGCLVNRYTTNP